MYKDHIITSIEYEIFLKYSNGMLHTLNDRWRLWGSEEQDLTTTLK